MYEASPYPLQPGVRPTYDLFLFFLELSLETKHPFSLHLSLSKLTLLRQLLHEFGFVQ